MKSFTIFSFVALSTLVTGAQSAKQCPSIEVRKEWRAFSDEERKAWIGAVNCLNKTPRTGRLNPPVNTTSYSQNDAAVHIPPIDPSSTNYDDWVYAHMNLNPLIHWTGLFLPWHRAYLFEWTNDLRSKCGYKGVVPYWAWEKDSADFENSVIWDTNSEYGLGGFSNDATDDYTVHTGALDITIAYPVPHKLRRRYTPNPFGGGTSPVSAASTFTPAEVEKLLSTPQGNFTAFQGYLEKFVSMHSAIHLIMGGDMGTVCPAGSLGTSACPVNPRATWSSNEPMFQLHHANVDRLWWLWQEKSTTSKTAFFGGSVQNLSSLAVYPNGQAPWLNKTSPIPSAGMWGNYAIGDTLDTRSWPWCYVYQ